MMIGNAREYYEQLVGKYISGEQLIEMSFDYATRKRLDNKKLDPDHMDIGVVGTNIGTPTTTTTPTDMCEAPLPPAADGPVVLDHLEPQHEIVELLMALGVQPVDAQRYLLQYYKRGTTLSACMRCMAEAQSLTLLLRPMALIDLACVCLICVS